MDSRDYDELKDRFDEKVRKFNEKTGRFERDKNPRNFTREGFDEGSDVSEEDELPDMEDVINKNMMHAERKQDLTNMLSFC